ncbi:hypothetical protein [Vulcanisaeta distributa]|uniref:Uncharacterized protein n=1 Tax=Vulcanisaeta distributa (strain DSM 14429 / JCM 11212 / NBRC 100878 / IC-017) TaxID=572478 RepID=E1QUQ0_VULDI|nr:hypothetical protein [Vulcanisaeta distributa]ADN51169.1 hypothetical protein Vdis_1795 [Vulcanisaeta distributa DSM 14429]
MVVELAKRSGRDLRRLLRRLNLVTGRCFDDNEFTSLLRSINIKFGNDYWLLGWREHKISTSSSLFVLSLIDRYNREYVVKIYVSIGIISMVLPANQLNLSDEISGITMLINGNTANLSGRILCITNVKVKEVP